MTKVAIKNENITSFGGIYHIMDVFSKLGFEKLTESVLGRYRMQRQGIQPWKLPGLSSSATFAVGIALRTSMRLQDSS